jgi:hypothetical protein
MMAEGSVKRTAGMLGRSLATGVAGIANLPFLASNLGSLAGRYVGEKLRGEKIDEPVKQFDYPSEKVRRAIDKLSGDKYKPETLGEKLGAGAAEFAAGGIGSLLYKAAGKAIPALLPQSGRELAGLVTAGAGSALGEEAFPQNPALGSLGGALLGGRVANARVPKGPEKTAGEFLEREGKLSQAKPLEEAGELIKKGASKYKEYASKESNKLYGVAEELIDKNATVPLSKTRSTIESMLTGKTAGHEKLLRDSPAGKLLEDIRNDIAVNEGHLPYETAKLYKDELSDLITTHGQLGNKAQGRIKNISSILDNEISSNLKKTNPEAHKALGAANDFYKRLSERDRDIFNTLIGEESGTGAFKKVLSDAKNVDAKKFEVAMKHLGKSDRETLSSSMISELGKNAENDFGFRTFIKNFKGLEKNAQKVVLSGLPKSSQEKFLKLMEIGEGPGKTLDRLWPVALGAGIGGPLGALGGQYLHSLARTSPRLLPIPEFIDGIYKASKIKNIGQQKSLILKTLKDIRHTHPELKEDIKLLKDGIEEYHKFSGENDSSKFMRGIIDEETRPEEEKKDSQRFMESLS